MVISGLNHTAFDHAVHVFAVAVTRPHAGLASRLLVRALPDGIKYPQGFNESSSTFASDDPPFPTFVAQCLQTLALAFISKPRARYAS